MISKQHISFSIQSFLFSLSMAWCWSSLLLKRSVLVVSSLKTLSSPVFCALRTFSETHPLHQTWSLPLINKLPNWSVENRDYSWKLSWINAKQRLWNVCKLKRRALQGFHHGVIPQLWLHRLKGRRRKDNHIENLAYIISYLNDYEQLPLDSHVSI